MTLSAQQCEYLIEFLSAIQDEDWDKLDYRFSRELYGVGERLVRLVERYQRLRDGSGEE